MGDHYIPRFYLRGFTRPDTNEIWTYTKGQKLNFLSQPASIANENRFYSPEVEAMLAQEIEGPANEVLHKIRERKDISSVDKLTLSTYIFVLWKRVPQGFARIKANMPQMRDRVSGQYMTEIEQLITEYPDKSDFYRSRLAQIDAALENVSTKKVKDIWLDVIHPNTTPNSINTLSQMNWQFLVIDGKPVFLTCDNPVFFFSNLGIGNRDSELTFPISSNIVLLANWKTPSKQQYQKAKSEIIVQVNRRTVSNATKYIYHALNEEWVTRLVNRSKHDLWRTINQHSKQST